MITWQYQQLKNDGTYTDWTDFGPDCTGTKFVYATTQGGVFQFKAIVTSNGQKQECWFLRSKDELKTVNGPYGAGKKGQPDAFGVCDNQMQVNIRNEAVRWLGSPAYEANTPVPAEYGFPAYPAKPEAIRCNIFVAHRASAAGAFVPGINGFFNLYPPLANQWAGIENCRPFSLLDSSGPTEEIDYWFPATNIYPRPGCIIAHPDYDDAGHCAIIDYDGGGIGAGVSGTVNKNYKKFYDGTSRSRQYQP